MRSLTLFLDRFHSCFSRTTIADIDFANTHILHVNRLWQREGSTDGPFHRSRAVMVATSGVRSCVGEGTRLFLDILHHRQSGTASLPRLRTDCGLAWNTDWKRGVSDSSNGLECSFVTANTSCYDKTTQSWLDTFQFPKIYTGQYLKNYKLIYSFIVNYCQ